MGQVQIGIVNGGCPCSIRSIVDNQEQCCRSHGCRDGHLHPLDGTHRLIIAPAMSSTS
jgi:hypothetical protein